MALTGRAWNAAECAGVRTTVPHHTALGLTMFRHITRARFRRVLIASLLLRPATVFAQSGAIADSLVARALAANPKVHAAEARLSSARSRIDPAGARPDPMLMAGIQNVPLSRQAAAHGAASGPDPMTMIMIGVGQTIPYPGKLSRRSNVARAQAVSAEARLAGAGREIRREVLDAYYDLVAARALFAIVERQLYLASSVIPASEARYLAGSSAQADVLRARVEAALLVRERNAAIEEERDALARLNATLDQPSATPVVTDSLVQALGLVAAVPSLDSLQAQALRTNPLLLERRASIAAQAAQAELASREHLPDLDVSLQYGQRDSRPDMITALVSVPIPVQRGRKQGATARAARFDVAVAEAELRAEENVVRADIARAVAAIERHRANLALLERAILPQSRASFASASATYQSGRAELLGVLDALQALFATETMYVRTLADVAKALADLEALVGEEDVP